MQNGCRSVFLIIFGMTFAAIKLHRDKNSSLKLFYEDIRVNFVPKFKQDKVETNIIL